MLRFTKFKKSFGRSMVLEINELVMKPGVYWIKGINGSGKTTLLKSIAGIIKFEGDIFLDHHVSIKRHPVAYRGLVNFAEAEPIFPAFLSGIEMIRLFSQAKQARINQYHSFAEQLKMKDNLADPIGSYSSGMVKKLSLILAFLGAPKVILLDEPLITLDSDSLVTIRSWIEEMHIQRQVSFLISSHQHLELPSLDVRELTIENKTLQSSLQ
jgi:ABC-2 type transport system ATP-binding protein